jgi:hypothetical protein
VRAVGAVEVTHFRRLLLCLPTQPHLGMAAVVRFHFLSILPASADFGLSRSKVGALLA